MRAERKAGNSMNKECVARSVWRRMRPQYQDEVPSGIPRGPYEVSTTTTRAANTINSFDPDASPDK